MSDGGLERRVGVVELSKKTNGIEGQGIWEKLCGDIKDNRTGRYLGEH